VPDPGAHVQEYGRRPSPGGWSQTSLLLAHAAWGESAQDDDAPWVRDRVNHRVVRGKCIVFIQGDLFAMRQMRFEMENPEDTGRTNPGISGGDTLIMSREIGTQRSRHKISDCSKQRQ
jgi:hypothetical protein